MPTTLLAGSTSIGGEPALYAKVLLSQADILQLASGAAGFITLVGAPGPSKAIYFDSIDWNFSFPGGAQFTGGSNLNLGYNNAGAISLAIGGVFLSSATIVGAASAAGRTVAMAQASNTLANQVNAPLVISLAGASFGGAGTGVLIVTVRYRIIELS